MALLDKSNPINLLIGINEDVLGRYDYSNPLAPKISLYWGVIGFVAYLLNIRPEALTCVVLAHELAHGYSHVGMDIDCKRWDTKSFHRSDRALVEGIAQYYTHLVCKRLNNRIPDVYNAYQLLLKDQPDDYKVHMNWVSDYSPEIVRTAIIEMRRNKITALNEFESILKSVANRIS